MSLPQSGKNGARDIGNDVLRGIAILAVVLIHTTADWDSRFAADGLYGRVYSAGRPVLNIWIPLFLIISGYYAGRTRVDNLQEVLVFLRRRLSRVFIPYLAWCLILFVWGWAWRKYSLSDLLPGIAFGRLNYPYYFIPIIIKFYFAYPILYFFAQRKSTQFLAFSLLAILYLFPIAGVGQYLPPKIQEFVGVLFRRTVHAEWLLFFFIGILFRWTHTLAYLKKHEVSRPVLLVFSLLTIGFFTVEAATWKHGGVLFLHFGAVFLFTWANIAFQNQSKQHGRQVQHSPLASGFSKLGMRAYTIYLLHEPSLGLARSLLQGVMPSRFPMAPVWEQLILVPIALFWPLVQAYLLRRVLGAWSSHLTG